MDDTKLRSDHGKADSPESQGEQQTEPQNELEVGPQDSRSVVADDVTVDDIATDDDTPDTAPDDAASDNAIANDINAKDATIDNAASADVILARPKKSHKRLAIVAVIALAALGVGGAAGALVLNQNNANEDAVNQSSSVSSTVPNQITDFDLAFLKNGEANQVYSPLSIKYALGMLEEGAAGDSRQQITSAIGSLNPQAYPNNENMSFANALFINDSLPDDTIKQSYIDTIDERFGAEVLRVPFTSAASINNWVSDKTFGLITDLLTDEMLKAPGGPEQYFALVNALAIDMEWVNKIQSYDEDYSIKFPHINYSSSVSRFRDFGFAKLSFNDSAMDVKSLKLAATIHKYDILDDLGVDNIRRTVLDEYTDWLEGDTCTEGWPEPEVYIEQYMEELGNGGYQTVSSSTDFLLYDDDEVKVFAKDLQAYDGTTLQYVGVMPKSNSLKDYIADLTTDRLASTLNQLKPLALESFKDGVVTNIVASIPVFQFEDKLDLVDTLKGMGITDVFSEKRANLANLANDSTGLYIGQAIHQTTVDFSNDGIKASAATALVGGKGSSGCGFYYDFDVPIEKIDLTFDNPYLFLIRDKDSGIIWFIGTVYEPTEY